MDVNPKRFKQSEECDTIVFEPNNNHQIMSLTVATDKSSHATEAQPPSNHHQPPSNSDESSEQANSEHDPVGPFELDGVLENIFDNLPGETLKTLRLVNKKFNSAATRILREKQEPIVFTDELYDSDKMLKLVRIFKESKDPPYVKFEIASKFFTVENEDLISEFFRVSSPAMEYLTICTDRNRDSKFEFAEVLFSTISLPKLKSLIFEDQTRNGAQAQYNHDFSNFFKALLNSACNLERLDLSFPKRFFDAEETVEQDSSNNFNQIPDDIITSNSTQHLKYLEISAKFNVGSLFLGLAKSVKLSTLHFRVKSVSLLEDSFTAFLESQSDTLLELKLTEERIGSSFQIKFPRMKRLKKITITSICEFENSTVTFAPFGYQEHLPSLEFISLWNCFGREERWTQFLCAASPSLTTAKIELPTQFRNPTLAQNISAVFPALKKLKIGFSMRVLNEEVMKIIFDTMSYLEELDIRTDMDEMNENLDHVLTGIPKALCRELRREPLSLMQPNIMEGVERAPSLINMTNLRRLDIVLDNHRAPFLTDVTGYFAFLQMPKLKILRFTRYGMSQECLDALMEKYRVELIPPHGRNFFEVEYLNFDDFDH